MHGNVLTSCAIMKAPSSSIPGRSRKDQLRDLVTKMRAWLTILTCRYKAAISSSGLSLMDRTPNLSYNRMSRKCILETELHESFCKTGGAKRMQRVSYREEVGFFYQPEEDNSHQCQVTSKHNSGSKYLFQFPAIRQGWWLYSILWDCHNCALQI